MKLTDLASPKASKQTAKVFESYFDRHINLDRLNRRQTTGMLTKVRGLLEEHQESPARHYSERNPNYLKLLMMEQALTQRLSEMLGANPPVGTASGASPEQQKAQTAMATATVAATKDPKLKAALTKASKGQNLTPDEQKLVAGAALMKTESRLRGAYRTLKESEVQQAQVVLAAQDMVDKMQSMLEDISELQFKELPALVDSIKNQVGIDQATQFNQDATAALTGLLQNVQAAKQQLDQALGVVTGQSAPPSDFGADIGAAAPAADIGAADADLAAAGDDLGAVGDDLDAAAAAASGDEEGGPATGALGRAKR